MEDDEGSGTAGASDAGAPLAASAKSQSTKLASAKESAWNCERLLPHSPKSDPITVPVQQLLSTRISRNAKGAYSLLVPTISGLWRCQSAYGHDMHGYAPGVLLLMIIMVMYSAITGSLQVLSLRTTLKMHLHSPASGLNPRFISSSWIAFCIHVST